MSAYIQAEKQRHVCAPACKCAATSPTHINIYIFVSTETLGCNGMRAMRLIDSICRSGRGQTRKPLFRLLRSASPEDHAVLFFNTEMQSLRGLRGPAGGCWAILGPQLRRHQFRLQETRRSGNASTPRCSLRPSQLKYTCQIAQVSDVGVTRHSAVRLHPHQPTRPHPAARAHAQQGPCRASAPPSSSPEADSDAQEGVADVLGSFLYWLVANGELAAARIPALRAAGTAGVAVS